MFSIAKMKALWELLQQGKSVADPHKWATHQVSTTMLGGVIIAIVQVCKAFNYELPIDSDTATALAGGAIALVNTVMSIMGNKHIGLPTGTSTEAQQTLPSVQQAIDTAEAQEAVQPVSSPNVEQTGIDADVIARARAWAAEHAKPTGDTAFDNPSYNNP